jgi:hypothetical protein
MPARWVSDEPKSRNRWADVARHLSMCCNCSTLPETLLLIKQSLRGRRDRTAPLLSERRLLRLAERLDTERARQARYRPGGAPVAPNKRKGVRR